MPLPRPREQKGDSQSILTSTPAAAGVWGACRPPRADARSPLLSLRKERDQDGEGESSTSGVVSGGGEASGRRSTSITALVVVPSPAARLAAFRSSFQSFPVGRRRSNRCRRSPSAALSPTLSLSKAQTRFTLSAMPASQARGLGVVPAVEMIAKLFSPAVARSFASEIASMADSTR